MITPRLKCIIDHVNGARIADIGTDHAYIPIHLIENGLCEYVIAADLCQGPVDIAKANIEKHGLTDKIEVRLGSGLSVLKKNEADTILIAGMGGQLISKIIDANIDTVGNSTLILQPMNAQYDLRKYLLNHNFMIADEDIAIEGHKVYNIMTVQYGKQEKFKNDIEYHLPVYLKNHRYYNKLYDKKHRELKKVVTGIENSKDIDTEKLNLYKYWLGELEKYESK